MAKDRRLILLGEAGIKNQQGLTVHRGYLVSAPPHSGLASQRGLPCRPGDSDGKERGHCGLRSIRPGRSSFPDVAGIREDFPHQMV